MRLYSRRGAIETFYYLMSADSRIDAEEIEKINEIGHEVDPENFENYRGEIETTYEMQMETLFDQEDFYDVIAEGVDKALAREPEGDGTGVSSRLLVWNMMVIAMIDGVYHSNERRLIKHVARISGVEKSVFLEMEQLIRANSAVDSELKMLSESDRPYSEIKIIVAEVEHRREVILAEAKALIADELDDDKIEILSFEPDMLERARDKVVDTVTPVAAKVSDEATRLFVDTKEKFGKVISPAAVNATRQAEKWLTGLKGKKGERGTK